VAWSWLESREFMVREGGGKREEGKERVGGYISKRKEDEEDSAIA